MFTGKKYVKIKSATANGNS